MTPLAVLIWMAPEGARLITRPRTTNVKLPWMIKAAAPLPPPVLVPSSSMRYTELSGSPGPLVFGLEPGCV